MRWMFISVLLLSLTFLFFQRRHERIHLSEAKCEDEEISD